MLGVSKSWSLVFTIAEEAWNYCCQVAGTAQGLPVQCFSSPTLNPVPRRKSSPVSHSFITRQLNNISASLLTQAECFTLLTPSDSSVSQKSCLACSADAQGHEAALPQVPAWADAAVQEQWQQPALDTSCQPHSINPAKGSPSPLVHPSCPPCPCGWTAWLWPAPKAPFSWQWNSAHSYEALWHMWQV